MDHVDGCDWHVRKWSNGYCEFIGRKIYNNVPLTRVLGESNLYTTESGNGLGKISYPFRLEKLYGSNTNASSDSTALIFTTLSQNSSTNSLIQTNLVCPCATSSRTENIIIDCYVFGYWKVDYQNTNHSIKEFPFFMEENVSESDTVASSIV